MMRIVVIFKIANTLFSLYAYNINLYFLFNKSISLKYLIFIDIILTIAPCIKANINGIINYNKTIT